MGKMPTRKFIDSIKGTYKRIVYVLLLVIKACPKYLVAVLICTLLLGVFPVINSVISATILRKIAYLDSSTVFGEIVNLIAIKMLFLLLTNIASYSNGTLLALAGSQVTDYIRKAIIQKAKDIDMEDYDSPDFYGKLENAKREAGSRPVAIISAIFGFVSTALSMIAYISVLSSFSVEILVLVILLGIPQCLFTHIYRRKNYTYNLSSTATRRQMAYYNNTVTDSKVSKEVRLYGLFDWFENRYTETFKQYFAGLKSITLAEFKWEIALSFLSVAITLGINLYTAYKALIGDIDIGDFSLYTSALNSLVSLMSVLVSHAAAIYSGTLFVDNLYEFLNRKRCLKVPETPQRVNFNSSHTIEFDNVSFTYPGCENKVLSNISFTVRTGEKLIVVGLNGSGKTTLIKLLLRLYDPTEGVIYLDGYDIRRYSPDELYKLYSAVFQDYGKFAETISNNIAFGNAYKPANVSEIFEAAVKGQADEFIQKTSDGFQTPLSKLFYENGVELSIGQWQRIAISRAFYRNAAVCIWDEPTASLDALSEKAIMNLIMEDDPSAIKILVSHRLLYSEKANQIIVLENGTIREKGTHEQLVQQNGVYKTLVSRTQQEAVTQK